MDDKRIIRAIYDVKMSGSMFSTFLADKISEIRIFEGEISF